MASRPPTRAAAALALAIYALIVAAGPALLHDFACSGHGAPHCLLCASVQSVSATPEPAAVLSRDRSEAGAVAVLTVPGGGAAVTASAADRAPPRA
jgi:hypothetical protein